MDTPKGLGDVVATITKAVGIKPCSSCKERQAWLNQRVSFGIPNTTTGFTFIIPKKDI